MENEGVPTATRREVPDRQQSGVSPVRPGGDAPVLVLVARSLRSASSGRLSPASATYRRLPDPDRSACCSTDVEERFNACRIVGGVCSISVPDAVAPSAVRARRSGPVSAAGTSPTTVRTELRRDFILGYSPASFSSPECGPSSRHLRAAVARPGPSPATVGCVRRSSVLQRSAPPL